jgi:hypothetical protein
MHLFEIGRLAALARAVINDFDLKFLGRLIDDRHNDLLFSWASSPAIRSSAASGNALPGWPSTARHSAPAWNIAHGVTPDKKHHRAQFPQLRISSVQMPMRMSICGRNAAIVSASSGAGNWPATSNPSFEASSAPATPGSVKIHSTTSCGDNPLPAIAEQPPPGTSGAANGAGPRPRRRARFRHAGAGSAGGAAGSTSNAGAGATGGAAGRPEPAKRSGTSSPTVTILRGVAARRIARNSGAITPSGSSTSLWPLDRGRQRVA